MADMTHDEAVEYMRENGRNLSMYFGARDNATTAAHLIVEHVESLQSQLAAANERADGLQRIVDEARAQKPVCITTLDDFGTVVAYPPPNVLHSVPLYAAAPVPAQPAVVQDAVVRALIEAAQMAVEMIETEKHERRHVRWALKDALLAAKPADTEGRKDE